MDADHGRGTCSRGADKTIEGLASCVLDNQHRPPALAHELHRPQCPRAV